MQNKIDTLIDLLNSLKSEKQKVYAIKLLSELVDIINNQSKTILELTERKFKIIPGEGENELDKYITILYIYGFTQQEISILNNDCLNFILKNSNQLTKKPTYNDLRRIKYFYNMYEFDKEEKPVDLQELKNYIINATES